MYNTFSTVYKTRLLLRAAYIYESEKSPHSKGQRKFLFRRRTLARTDETASVVTTHSYFKAEWAVRIRSTVIVSLSKSHQIRLI